MRFDTLFNWRLSTLEGNGVSAQNLADALSCEGLRRDEIPENMDALVTAFRHLRRDARLQAARDFYVRGCPLKMETKMAKKHIGSTLQSLLTELGEEEAIRTLTARKNAMAPPPPVPEKGVQFEYCECGCKGHLAEVGGLVFWMYQDLEVVETLHEGKISNEVRVSRVRLRNQHGWASGSLGEFETVKEAQAVANTIAKNALVKMAEALHLKIDVSSV